MSPTQETGLATSSSDTAGRWPQLVDTNRRKAKRFGVNWQPAVIAIDAKGRIAGVDQSYDRERAWNRLAAKLP